MDIKTELGSFKKKIDVEIDLYLNEVIKEAAKSDALLTDMLGYARKFIMGGGKRLRPALMYQGYLLAGGKEYKRALKACVGIELVHAFLLIHDDIIDRDNKRHGKDTLHYRYSKIGKRFFRDKDHKHFGSSMAIIVGDLIAALGSQRLFTSKFHPSVVVEALNKMQSIVSHTIVGEARDVYMEYSKKASEKEVLNMYKNKTARYTIEGPLHLGAILAGGNNDLLNKISKYAVPLGIAFQIQDDILGIFGNKKKVGKPEGSDIQEGKMTILIIKAMENATKEQKKTLQRALGNPELSKKDIIDVKEILRESGALQYANEMAQGYSQEGREALKNVPSKNVKAMEFLDGIACYITQREI